MSAPIHWAPLPDDGRECPLLRVDQYGRLVADACLLLRPELQTDSVRAALVAVPRPSPAIEAACGAGYEIAVDLPPRVRTGRLAEIMADDQVHTLIARIGHGWIIEQCPVFRTDTGRLTDDARAALVALRARVGVLCAPRVPAPEPEPA